MSKVKSDEYTVAVLPLASIRKSEVALREVNTESVEFLELVDSIKDRGVILPITVRQGVDPETEQSVYWLVDGLHRFTGSEYAGKETIPCNILSATPSEAEELQLIANAIRVDTKPGEFAMHLNRILANNPTLTIAGLAVKLKKSSQWLASQLSLKNLDKPIRELVDKGQMIVANAIALAKLPPNEQSDFIEPACGMNAIEFAPIANNRVKELRDARREGRKAAPAAFVASAHLRKMSEIRSEYDKPSVILGIIADESLRTTEEIVKSTLAWVQHLDRASIASNQAKFDQRLKDREEAKVKRDAERAAKKDAAAKEAVAAVNAAHA